MSQAPHIIFYDESTVFDGTLEKTPPRPRIKADYGIEIPNITGYAETIVKAVIKQMPMVKYCTKCTVWFRARTWEFGYINFCPNCGASLNQLHEFAFMSQVNASKIKKKLLSWEYPNGKYWEDLRNGRNKKHTSR